MMMTTHQFLTRPLPCAVVICHVSCKKAGQELEQGFPSSFIPGETLGQSHQASFLRVMARSDSKKNSKNSKNSPNNSNNSPNDSNNSPNNSNNS